jgi:cytolysin-activating lysine-acyltransferase
MRGEKLMNKAGAGSRHAEAPRLGEAALQKAYAELVRIHAGSSANGNRSAAGHTQSQPEPLSKIVAQMLGEITWLMTQSPRHRAFLVNDLQWQLMPAILLRQFRIFYRGEQPFCVVLWALVDDLVAKRIDAGHKQLAAVEWNSGSNMRIIDVVAPFRAA